MITAVNMNCLNFFIEVSCVLGLSFRLRCLHSFVFDGNPTKPMLPSYYHPVLFASFFGFFGDYEGVPQFRQVSTGSRPPHTLGGVTRRANVQAMDSPSRRHSGFPPQLLHRVNLPVTTLAAPVPVRHAPATPPKFRRQEALRLLAHPFPKDHGCGTAR
jgi:hypothetical protein